MSDVIKLLESGVDEVKAGLSGLSHDDLLKLKAAEEAGKKRKGVLDALADAIADADAKRAGGFTNTAATSASAATTAAQANIPPADTIDTSGSPQQIVPDVDMSHPAVDADPRAGTSEDANRIDFNDPNKPGHQVVEEALASRDA